MRGDVVKLKPSGLGRTLSTGLVLSLLVMAASMIFLLYNVQTEGDKMPYVLSFALPFGIPAVLLAALGVVSMGHLDEDKWKIWLFIASILSVGLEVGVGVLGIALWNNLSIGVSLLFIAACLLGLAITFFVSRNDKAK